MKKLSFLIAAHNEEKIIGKTLQSLYNLPYENYEVIIGLDGCSDGTEDIVKKFMKKSDKFKYYHTNHRSGKPAVIDSIIEKATGDIVIINDADWTLSFFDKSYLKKMVEVFDDPEVGGIADSFSVEWKKNFFGNNFGYKMVAYSHQFWIDFQKKKFTLKNGERFFITNPAMFLTNIFRKKLYFKNTSLGDDFERTHHILNKGYKIVVFNNIKYPRFRVVYDKIKLKDFFRQKIRTAIARRQIAQNIEIKNDYSGYNFQNVFYILKRGWQGDPAKGIYVSTWVLLTAIATVVARFKSLDTKKGWEMRMTR